MCKHKSSNLSYSIAAVARQVHGTYNNIMVLHEIQKDTLSTEKESHLNPLTFAVCITSMVPYYHTIPYASLSFFVIDIEWGRDQKRRCRCFLYGIYSWSSANICNVSSLTALFLLGSDYFSESAWSRIRLPFSNNLIFCCCKKTSYGNRS